MILPTLAAVVLGPYSGNRSAVVGSEHGGNSRPQAAGAKNDARQL